MINLKGRCLCGAVRIAGEFPSGDVDACHCTMCRRWAAGPLMALPHGAKVELDGAENVSVYKSSKWAERAFCKTCGTLLYWRLSGTDHVSYSAGLVDDDPALKFVTEIFIDEKPGYYEFGNDTKKMTGAEVIAAFSGGQAKD